jgi:beta-glucosidase
MAFVAFLQLGHAKQATQQAIEAKINSQVDAQLAQMPLAQKIAYLRDFMYKDAKLPTIGFAEALHGVVGTVLYGPAKQIATTSFGQVIGMGETWDPELIQRAGRVTGYEARYITQSKKYNRTMLALWAPNADLARDPRWGRTEESYGEDPFLAGTMSAAYVRGIQGDNPRYWLAASLVKHFLANSNETARGGSSSNFGERLFYEYYSVPFRMAFADGGSRSFMASYNAWNGVPMTVNPILKTVVRDQWHVDGIVSTDAGAIENLVSLHKYAATMEDAYVACVKAGVNQLLPVKMDPTDYIAMAVKDGKLTEADLDAAIRGKIRTTIRLGLLDPPASVPYSQIGREGEPEPWTLPAQKELARRVVEESVVLLKNEDAFLPLNKNKVKNIAVIGPDADKVQTGGLYDGVLSYAVTPLDGIRQHAGSDAHVTFSPDNSNGVAVEAAKKADVAIVVVGNKPFCGDKEMFGQFSENASSKPCSDPGWGREGRDRESLDLTEESLVKSVYAANPHTVLVLVSGFPFAVNWSQEHVPTILHIAHASQEQGNGLAEVLFGEYNPAGRVTQTWPTSLSQLPPMMDYDITHGRTYMYFTGKPLYAFGHGLSYTTFSYSNLKTVLPGTSTDGTILVTLEVKNSGQLAGDEVVQIYVSHKSSQVLRPILELKAFRRISLAAGATRTVQFNIPVQSLAYWDETSHAFRVETDNLQIGAGSASDDIRLRSTVTVVSASSREGVK